MAASAFELAVVVPTFNEIENIEASVCAVQTILEMNDVGLASIDDEPALGKAKLNQPLIHSIAK